MYIIGVDTGGTKTKAVVVDESRSIVGTGDAGPGNYRVAGEDGARRNVEAAIEEALSRGEIDRTETLVGGFGMGTLDTEADREIIDGFLADIDVVDERYVENDVAVAYYALTAGDPGVVVVAGTGAMAYGRNGAGDTARSSGWGWLFGDEGSGFYAAKRGLQAATKACDGRGESTALVDAARDHFGLDSMEDVFAEVYDDFEHPKEIATFAEPVAETAENGDGVALGIVEEAGQELADAAEAVVERLNLGPSPMVGCVGGFGTAAVVSEQFERSLADRFPEATFVAPVAHPVVGSVALVADRRGIDVSREDLRGMDREIERAAKGDD